MRGGLSEWKDRFKTSIILIERSDPSFPLCRQSEEAVVHFDSKGYSKRQSVKASLDGI